MKINPSNGQCQYCHTEQDDENYRYCNKRCSWKHDQIKKMNHLFVKNETDGNCTTCNRRYLDHTAAARCESCQKCGICNIVDDLLLCDACADKIKNNQFDLIE